MPFLLSSSLLKSSDINPKKAILVYENGKEEGSVARSGEISLLMRSCVEKASVSASCRKKRGSITLECVYCIPMFLLAAVCLIWNLEIRAVQITVKSSLHKAGKVMAQEAYMNPLFSAARLEELIVENIGENRMQKSLLKGGSNAIDCSGSWMHPGSRIMELKASYQINLPFPVFFVPPILCKEQMRIKGWCGYEKEWFLTGETEAKVYITENGIVYHKDPGCSYLEPSVRMADKGQIGQLRNQDGERYTPCERCASLAASYVYITDYGNRYHCSLLCSGLKRTIYAVPVSEAKGRRPCAKCGN